MQPYDFQLLTSIPLFPVFSCSFECHILSFHQVAQQVHSFPTSCSLPLHSSLNHTITIHFLANAPTTRLRLVTVSNMVLVSVTLCRTSSLLILSTPLIFSILLQIHISMASNLFLSAWVIDHVSDAYNTTLHNTLFTILFSTLYSN